MTSTIKKGDAAVKAAILILAGENYLVEQIHKSRFQPQDFFGLWDLIAVKPGKTRFIQVSTKYYGQRTAEFKHFAEAFPKSDSQTKEFWRYKDDGIFDIRIL